MHGCPCFILVRPRDSLLTPNEQCCEVPNSSTSSPVKGTIIQSVGPIFTRDCIEQVDRLVSDRYGTLTSILCRFGAHFSPSLIQNTQQPTMVSPDVTHAIRSSKSKYCRYIDTKQWRSLEAISLPDATFSFLNPDGSVQKSGAFRFDYSSPKGFTHDLQSLFRRAQTLRQIGGGELKETGDGSVDAIWSMEDQIVYPSILGIIPLEVRGGGYYHETWQCVDGNWKLKSLRLERSYNRPSLAAQLLSPLSSLL